MVWSSGVTPAAVMRTRTRPSPGVGLGTSTSFRPPYPVNDSARIALMTPPSSPSPRYGPVEPDRGRKKCFHRRRGHGSWLGACGVSSLRRHAEPLDRCDLWLVLPVGMSVEVRRIHASSGHACINMYLHTILTA